MSGVIQKLKTLADARAAAKAPIERMQQQDQQRLDAHRVREQQPCSSVQTLLDDLETCIWPGSESLPLASSKHQKLTRLMAFRFSRSNSLGPLARMSSTYSANMQV